MFEEGHGERGEQHREEDGCFAEEDSKWVQLPIEIDERQPGNDQEKQVANPVGQGEKENPEDEQTPSGTQSIGAEEDVLGRDVRRLERTLRRCGIEGLEVFGHCFECSVAARCP